MTIIYIILSALVSSLLTMLAIVQERKMLRHMQVAAALLRYSYAKFDCEHDMLIVADGNCIYVFHKTDNWWHYTDATACEADIHATVDKIVDRLVFAND